MPFRLIIKLFGFKFGPIIDKEIYPLSSYMEVADEDSQSCYAALDQLKDYEHPVSIKVSDMDHPWVVGDQCKTGEAPISNRAFSQISIPGYIGELL